ncbi:SulP family inorganic anion transporter [Kocuria sp.]|uniref:SulP family inorganic anion transporter n=1 Tax=Kocuria sp. TaxID=1871328 RepID=UPI0026DD140A|nr:SulP family inorganic anion transporter [Kocuria sp.]MDO4917936.1 SulP family inorganic anion transporter [Kocuria sp.]
MTTTSTTASPEERQSVWRTLHTPRWLKSEVLGALVVGLALIPEAIAFSVIAGVDPQTGLFAAALMAMTVAVSGGRPAMISAATGATALVMAPLVASHGVHYLVAAVILAGVMQILLGAVGFARVIRFIPRSVMVGFVNGLAVLQFVPQLRELTGVPWQVYPVAAVALLILFGLPRLTTAVPAPLVAIAVLTPAVLLLGWHVPTVADKGALPQSWPHLGLPDVPFTWDTLRTIAPYSLSMAVVGIMESLMTAKLVDDITDTRSSKTRETWGQGVGNVVSGCFGTMGGCGMIGQTLINVRVSGARTRISTFLAGAFLLVLVVLLGDTVGIIPMAVLAAVMIYVAGTQFDWHSVNPATLRRMPPSETLVMLVTLVVTVLTHNLAVGVAAGVLTAVVAFARRVAHVVTVERSLDDDGGSVTYRVHGELFFASSNDLYTQFRYAEDPQRVVVDFADSHIWDASTVAALDSVTEKYRQQGTRVEVRNLNLDSRRLRARLSGSLP